MAELIRLEDVFFYYHSPEGEEVKPAIDGVTLSIDEGEFVAILGHNGSGKSTLAKLLNGIILPSGGDVIVSGMNTKDQDKIYDIRRKVGMVFQNPDNQIVATVVEEDVAFALENLGMPSEEIREKVDEALEAVGMYEYRGHAPHLLSGGQKQRVAIAGVIAMKPTCIVLDEPTAMLDPKGRVDVMETIRNLNKEYGITIILITHHMEEAAEASRVIVMRRGRIEFDDTPEMVFSKPEEMDDAGLSVPQTVEILNEIKKAGFDMDIGALTVDECAERIKNFLEEK